MFESKEQSEIKLSFKNCIYKVHVSSFLNTQKEMVYTIKLLKHFIDKLVRNMSFEYSQVRNIIFIGNKRCYTYFCEQRVGTRL